MAAIEIVGGLLTPDVFNLIAAPESNAEIRRDYGIPDGLDLRDEIARAYRMAEALWTGFDAAKGRDLSLPARFVPHFLATVFGFDDLGPVDPVQMGERIFPIGNVARAGRVPVVIAPVVSEEQRRSGLDTTHQVFADGNRRRSATLLLQEYLNAEEACLWGITTDGLTLRLLRDNLSLTRPAWIEIDLAKIFRDGLYADFSALWLLIHASRFGPAGGGPSDSALERWRELGQQDGVAARDMLRNGVEAALTLLGQGAIEHPDNTILREALANGTLTAQGLYEELLGALYRLIFLFAAEDRDLLHPPGTPANRRAAYARGYGMGRLRDRAMRRASWDRHHDAWDGLRAVFRVLATGAPALGLPALGGLFEPGRTPHLDEARIGNRFVMEAIFRLAWLRPTGQRLARVNWRDMRTEELGSVYEGLLELIPDASAEARRFTFRDTDGAAGSERRSTGSYYTPDALVKLVLDTTIDPLLDRAQAAGGNDPVSNILDLTILDPACGSGHFLLGAAHRAAARIASLRSPGAPGRDDYQHALREVISHMIYGVDRNPLAVELCKVALWIEALEPGQPLSFLDARVLCGDSLIGVQDLDCLKDGIPDDAYAALTGDDPPTARTNRRWNAEQRGGNIATGLLENLRAPTKMLEEARVAAGMPEDSIGAIDAKRLAFNRLFTGKGWAQRKRACDLYVAAFFTPKTPLHDAPTSAERNRIALSQPIVPLTGHVWAAAHGAEVYGPLADAAEALCGELRVLHWPLAFPTVLARGGFDALIGNPPWEVSQLSEKEFFVSRDPEIAALPGAARKRRIEALPEANPTLWAAYVREKRTFDCANEYYRGAGRFEQTAKGKLNTYALFAEAFASLVRSEGRAGVIVPTGIVTDSSTAEFFASVLRTRSLAHLATFDNEAFIFPGVHHAFRFCVLITSKQPVATPVIRFLIRRFDQLDDDRRRVSLTPEQIARINPNTKTAPIFRARADAELTAAIYDRVPVLIEERSEEDGGDINPWGIEFQQGLFNMTSASHLFRTANQLAGADWSRDGADWVNGDATERVVPLYEAKMIHHYDHRWATYAGANAGNEDVARDVTLGEKADPNFEPTARYWVPEAEVTLRAARVSASLKSAAREENPKKVLKTLAEHVAAAWTEAYGRPAIGDDLIRTLGQNHAWQDALGATPDRWLAWPATRKALGQLQRRVPLTKEDLLALTDGPPGILDMAERLIDRKQPRWLMGWRQNSRSSDERTYINALLPKIGVGHSVFLVHIADQTPELHAVLLALSASLPYDFVVRQKISGTNLSFYYVQQFPTIPPEQFTQFDVSFVIPRVLELIYTSHAMRPWAEVLGCAGPPFGWNPDRRMQLRAELDGLFARKYGLTRDELRYILDPADTHGSDYPSETFRVLRDREIGQFGEYRTQRLVLEAYDRLEGVS